MFKRITIAAAVAAFAIVLMPVASEAGSRARGGEARASCGLTKMFQRTAHRTDRAVRSIFHRDRTRHAHRSHRAHRAHRAHRSYK